VGTAGVVAPTADAPSTGVFVCGVEVDVAAVEPTGSGGSEGAGTVLASGVVGCVEVVLVGGATCVVPVAAACVPVEEVVGGALLDTSVEEVEATGSVDVLLDVPVDDVVEVSEVEKNVYVALDGGGDEGGGEDAGACVVVAADGDAATAGIPIVSTTVGAFANGSGGLDGRGAGVAFAIVSVTTGTRLTTRRPGIRATTCLVAGAGGTTAALGAACSFGTAKLAKCRFGSRSEATAGEAAGNRRASIVGAA